jgi:diguanylate cyclase (GGDEF)-like protein
MGQASSHSRTGHQPGVTLFGLKKASPVAYPDYPLPLNENQRLRELDRYALDPGIDYPHLNEVLELCTDVLDMPIGLITVVAENDQRFVCRHGLDALGTPRPMAFCSHAIAVNQILIVPDTHDDERFCTNPLVIDKPGIRFYAGAPLQTPRNFPLGTLCVLDRQPHVWTERQARHLKGFAHLAMREIEWRYRATLCPVTGLPRRDLLFRLGARELDLARRHSKPLCLLQLDLDNFSQINLRWGHKAGDQVLIDFCHLCESYLGEDDLLVRLYDEAFGLLLVNRNAEEAVAIGEELRLAAKRMLGIFTESGYHLHLSGGLTCVSESDRDFTDIFTRSERALFLAKANGRDQISLLLLG